MASYYFDSDEDYREDDKRDQLIEMKLSRGELKECRKCDLIFEPPDYDTNLCPDCESSQESGSSEDGISSAEHADRAEKAYRLK